MTDDITLDDLGLPEVLYDPEDGTEWRLSRPDVSIPVVLHRPDGAEGDPMEHAGSYPLESLRSKLEYGDLVTEAPTADDAEEDIEEFTCEECGESFDSQQALSGHQSVHSEDDDA